MDGGPDASGLDAGEPDPMDAGVSDPTDAEVGLRDGAVDPSDGGDAGTGDIGRPDGGPDDAGETTAFACLELSGDKEARGTTVLLARYAPPTPPSTFSIFGTVFESEACGGKVMAESALVNLIADGSDVDVADAGDPDTSLSDADASFVDGSDTGPSDGLDAEAVDVATDASSGDGGDAGQGLDAGGPGDA